MARHMSKEQSDEKPTTPTEKLLFTKQEENQSKADPEMPNSSNPLIKIRWLIVSKAAVRSNNTSTEHQQQLKHSVKCRLRKPD